MTDEEAVSEGEVDIVELEDDWEGAGSPAVCPSSNLSSNETSCASQGHNTYVYITESNAISEPVITSV
jgi:hypothetical protein